jgi:hypothetical protein
MHPDGEDIVPANEAHTPVYASTAGWAEAVVEEEEQEEQEQTQEREQEVTKEEKVEESEAAPAPQNDYVEEPYQVANEGIGGGSTDDFSAAEHTHVLRQDIEEIVRVEGPICLTLLTRRLGEKYDFNRLTKTKLARVEQVVKFADVRVDKDRKEEEILLWPVDLTPETFKKYRPNTEANNERGADEIPIEEFKNCVHSIMLNAIQIDRAELLRQTSRKFGFQRTGKNLSDRISKAIDRLVREKKLQRAAGGTISIAE